MQNKVKWQKYKKPQTTQQQLMHVEAMSNDNKKN